MTAITSSAASETDSARKRTAGCSQAIYHKELATSLNVCPKCGHHFRLNAAERLRMLFDDEPWTEYDRGLVSTDPLKFTDTKPYRARLDASILRTLTKPLRALPVAVGALLALGLGVIAGVVIDALATKTKLTEFVDMVHNTINTNPLLLLGVTLGMIFIPMLIGVALEKKGD